MAVTYTWHNQHVEVYATLQDVHGVEKNNVITGVVFRLRATHDSHIDPLTGELIFREISSKLVFDKETMDFGPIDAFKEYDDVREVDINSWVEEIIGAEEIVRLKLGLEIMINNEITPTIYWDVKSDPVEEEEGQ